MKFRIYPVHGSDITIEADVYEGNAQAVTFSNKVPKSADQPDCVVIYQHVATFYIRNIIGFERID